MIIRKATKEDLPQILEIEQDSFTKPWTLDALLHEVQYADAHFEVAVIDDNVVGFCILRHLSVDGEIINFAVKKEYRRCGVGDSLLKSLINYADENNLESIFLEVRQSNEPAINLYKKQGFFEIGIRKNYYDKPIENAITMAYKVV